MRFGISIRGNCELMKQIGEVRIGFAHTALFLTEELGHSFLVND